MRRMSSAEIEISQIVSNMLVQPVVQCSISDQAHALSFICENLGMNEIANQLSIFFPSHTLDVNDVIDASLVPELLTDDNLDIKTQYHLAYSASCRFGLFDIGNFLARRVMTNDFAS